MCRRPARRHRGEARRRTAAEQRSHGASRRAVIVTLVRNATLVVEYAGRRLLVAPMLGEPGSAPPIGNTPNQRPNPLVPLPVPAPELVANVDALLVTHLHKDHFDATAEAALPRSLPLACQPEDASYLRGLGFSDVRPVEDGEIDLLGISVSRTRAVTAPARSLSSWRPCPASCSG